MNRYTKTLYIALFLLGSYSHLGAMDEKTERATSALYNLLNSKSPNMLLAKAFIEKGADVNLVANDAGLSLFMLACSIPTVNREMLQMLCDHASLTQTCTHGLNALHHACAEGHTNAVTVILEKGMDPNCETQNEGKWTPLQLATQYQRIDSIKLLLNHKKLEIDKQDTFGNSALHFACRTITIKNRKLPYNTEILQLLLDHKASLDICNDEEAPPVACAVFDNFLEGAKILIERGANIHLVSRTGQTLLHAACGKTDKKCIEYFVNKGLAINAKSVDGFTPACVLVQENKLEELQFLHEQGANLTATDSAGITLLMRAACFGDTNMIEYLFSKTDPNAQDIYNNTALTWALISNNLIRLECFLKKYKTYANSLGEAQGKSFLKNIFFSKNKHNKSFMDRVKKKNDTHLTQLVKKYASEKNSSSSRKKKNTTQVLQPAKSTEKSIPIEQTVQEEKAPTPHLTENITFADRYTNWFNQAWLEKTRISMQEQPTWKFEQSRFYHQIPQEVVKILRVFGSQKIQESQSLKEKNTCYMLEGIMQFQNPTQNPWFPGRQHQPGLYHCTADAQGTIYHVGFKPFNPTSITLFDVMPQRNIAFTKNNIATKELFAFWKPEQNVRHVVFRL